MICRDSIPRVNRNWCASETGAILQIETSFALGSGFIVKLMLAAISVRGLRFGTRRQENATSPVNYYCCSVRVLDSNFAL
jgi:hypothetical protein